MPAVHFDPMLDDAQRRERLFAGDILILRATKSSLALVELARQMLEEAFAPRDPRLVHRHRTAEEVAGILSRMKPAFIHHPECKRLIVAMMEEQGIDLDKLYFDVPRMRSAYPAHFLSSGIAYAYHPHRDTWYSAPMCQINWWMPIYPVEPGNAMGLYTKYFDEPVKNNSDVYNYYDWNTVGRATAAQYIKSDTRVQPKPQEMLRGPTLQFLPPPGGMILFSAAHLHETVPNTTEVARYSIDFRTIDLDDAAARRGAPNVDSHSTGTTLRDFVCAADGEVLPEEIIRLYDDGTATADKILRFGDRLLHTETTA
ncbi:MAG TPA: hypothetical protein VFJ18_11390 [Pararhizobium sp.]|nr:hypothetical protein [Pararhizobium sp.]